MHTFRGFSVHGGPPVVYVPAELSGTGKPYYLGIMHHFEKWVCVLRHAWGSARAIPACKNASLLADLVSAFHLSAAPAISLTPPLQLTLQLTWRCAAPQPTPRFSNGKVRLYRHFAYKFEPHPPFAITSVSDELPLQYNQVYQVSG